MKNTVKMFFDLETTGTKSHRHGIHQISGIIEVNDEAVESFDWRVKPNPKAQIELDALKVSNTTLEDLESFPEMKWVYFEMLKMLGKYVDRFDRKDKIFLIGFRNTSFDDQFLRAWFEQNEDPFFGSWFWSNSSDVSVLATEFLMDVRSEMSNFKLRTVAKKLGLEVDPEKLHDGAYDVMLTRMMYRIVKGLEEDLF